MRSNGRRYSLDQQAALADAAVAETTERRQDLVLRDVVAYCDEVLARQGFVLDGRGSRADRSWVRFSKPGCDLRGHTGLLRLLVAHSSSDRAVLLDAYHEDSLLNIHTPVGKIVHRYTADAEQRNLASELASFIGRCSA